jgi:hypothetical protein
MSANFPSLDLYDVAYLAGGLPRVVDAALVELVGTGRVRVDSPGELAAVHPGGGHPVEAAVLDMIGTHGQRPADTVRWWLMADDRLRAVGRRLVHAGLLHRLPWPHSLGAAGRARPRTRLGDGALGTVAVACWANPEHDPTDAFRVALHGRAALPDPHLRVTLFALPPSLPGTDPVERTQRRHDVGAGS